MGATKTKQYTTDSIELAKIARALGHPARITIIKNLKEHSYFRNVDFQTVLNLSQSTVHSHLLKLKSAGLIQMHYFPHEYKVELCNEILEELNYLIRDLN